MQGGVIRDRKNQALYEVFCLMAVLWGLVALLEGLAMLFWPHLRELYRYPFVALLVVTLASAGICWRAKRGLF